MVDFYGVIGSLVLILIIMFVGYDWIHRWRNERREKKLIKRDQKHAK